VVLRGSPARSRHLPLCRPHLFLPLRVLVVRAAVQRHTRQPRRHTRAVPSQRPHAPLERRKVGERRSALPAAAPLLHCAHEQRHPRMVRACFLPGEQARGSARRGGASARGGDVHGVVSGGARARAAEFLSSVYSAPQPRRWHCSMPSARGEGTASTPSCTATEEHAGMAAACGRRSLTPAAATAPGSARGCALRARMRRISAPQLRRSGAGSAAAHARTSARCRAAHPG
jgi:hypothetical protein